MAQAWPGITPRHVPLKLADGDVFVPATATPDPSLLVGIKGGPPSDPAHEGLKDLTLVVLNTRTLVASAVRKYVAPLNPGQVDADDRWIVWLEAADNYFQDWRLMASDYRGENLRQVAVAGHDSSGRPVPSAAFVPSVDHGIVVWSAREVKSPSSGFKMSVYAAEIATGQSRVIAQDAAGPKISWPYVIYSQQVGDSGLGAPGQLVRLNLETGAVESIQGIQSAFFYAVHGNAIAWVDLSRRVLKLRDLGTGKDELLADVSASETSYVQFPVLTDRLVAWSQDGGEWVYDRKLKVRIQLTAHPLFGDVYLRGHQLVWREPLSPTDPNWRSWSTIKDTAVLDLGRLG